MEACLDPWLRPVCAPRWTRHFYHRYGLSKQIPSKKVLQGMQPPHHANGHITPPLGAPWQMLSHLCQDTTSLCLSSPSLTMALPGGEHTRSMPAWGILPKNLWSPEVCKLGVVVGRRGVNGTLLSPLKKFEVETHHVKWINQQHCLFSHLLKVSQDQFYPHWQNRKLIVRTMGNFPSNKTLLGATKILEANRKDKKTWRWG